METLEYEFVTSVGHSCVYDENYTITKRNKASRKVDQMFNLRVNPKLAIKDYLYRSA